MNFVKEIARASNYERQIDGLHSKSRSNPRFLQIVQNEVALKNFIFDKTRIAKKLARTVGTGKYVFTPPRAHKAMLDKERVLYSFEITDYIVNGVVAELVADAIKPHLSPRVFSYQKGKSQWSAIRELAAFIRLHRQAIADPKQRGLYVLRCDIKNYSSSIPVSDDAPLWGQLKKCLFEHFKDEAEFQSFFPLIQGVVHPIPVDEGADLIDPLVGLPTGSQITPVIDNLYTTALDEALDQIPDGYYARYGDDIAFCHPNPQTARDAYLKIEEVLKPLGLEINLKKSKRFYFNGAGRSDAQNPDFKGANSITFLGFNVCFNGMLRLTTEKKRDFLRDLQGRAKQTILIFSKKDKNLSESQKGEILCRALNRALNWRSSYCHRYVSALFNVVTDRKQLKDIDYWIARMIIRALTGDAGVRGFRKIPYKKIRSEWGLMSIVHHRNKRPSQKK